MTRCSMVVNDSSDLVETHKCLYSPQMRDLNLEEIRHRVPCDGVGRPCNVAVSREDCGFAASTRSLTEDRDAARLLHNLEVMSARTAHGG
jgi:hypothetical protein